MARRAVKSRMERIAREKAEQDALMREAKALRDAQAKDPDPDEARKRRVQKQIDLLLTDMEKAKTIDARLTIAAAVERLWKLVQPVAGRAKPRRSPAPGGVEPVG